MERDRGAVLTIRAATRGVVDFTKARIYDPKWWRATNMLIEAMARDDEIELLRNSLAINCALAANAKLEPKSFESVQTNAKRLFNDIINVVHPWAHKSLEEVELDGLNDLTSTYKRIFGDPNDPEFRKLMQQEAEQNKRDRQAAIPEDPEVALNRRLAERDLKFRKRGLPT